MITKNKTITFTIFAVCFIAAYSVAWVYQASRLNELTENLLAELTYNINDDKSEFFYSHIKVTGYPFTFNIEIFKPHYVSIEEGKEVEIKTTENFIITTNIFANHFEFKLPQKIDFTTSQTGANRPLQLVFEKSPDISLEKEIFTGIKSLIPWMFRQFGGVMDFKDIGKGFSEFIYEDEGFKIIELNSKSKVASFARNFAKIATKNISDNRIAMEFMTEVKNGNFTGFYPKNDKIMRLQQLDYEFDASYFGPAAIKSYNNDTEGFEFRLSKFNINSDLFVFNINGHIQTAHDDIFPFGVVNIEVDNYEQLIDYTIATINSLIDNSVLATAKIKNNYAIKFKKFANKILASNTIDSNDNSIYKIAIKREKGDDLFVGAQSLQEVIKLYKQTFTVASVKPHSAPVINP